MNRILLVLLSRRLAFGRHTLNNQLPPPSRRLVTRTSILLQPLQLR